MQGNILVPRTLGWLSDTAFALPLRLFFGVFEFLLDLRGEERVVRVGSCGRFETTAWLEASGSVVGEEAESCT